MTRPYGSAAASAPAPQGARPVGHARLRRLAADGWEVAIHPVVGAPHRHVCHTMLDAARFLDQAEVQEIHVWSARTSAYVEVGPDSLRPVLEAGR